jgi:hypothetical protein
MFAEQGKITGRNAVPAVFTGNQKKVACHTIIDLYVIRDRSAFVLVFALSKRIRAGD